MKRMTSVLLCGFVFAILSPTRVQASATSARLSVSPNLNLHEGQRVVIRGAGWVPGELVTIEQCDNECQLDSGPLATATVGHNGTFEAHGRVSRWLDFSECGERRARCAIRASSISNVGLRRTHFALLGRARTGRVRISNSTPADGNNIIVRVADWRSESGLVMGQCPVGFRDIYAQCTGGVFNTAPDIYVLPNGRGRNEMTVTRMLLDRSTGATIDCSVRGACVVAVMDVSSRRIARTAITVSPSVAAANPAAAVVRDFAGTSTAAFKLFTGPRCPGNGLISSFAGQLARATRPTWTFDVPNLCVASIGHQASFSGEATIVTARYQIHGSLTGTWQSLNGVPATIFTIAIHGGTGEFAHATGVISVSGSFDFSTGNFSGAMTGTVTTP